MIKTAILLSMSVLGLSTFALGTEAYTSFTNYAPTDPTPSTENMGLYSSYLIKSETASSPQALETWLIANGGISKENLSSLAGDDSLSVLSETSGWNDEAHQYQLNYANCRADADLNNYLVVLAANGASEDVAYEIILGTKETVPVQQYETYKYTFTDTAAGSVTWKTIPEPTSGLLLLLGVAGLALRRPLCARQFSH